MAKSNTTKPKKTKKTRVKSDFHKQTVLFGWALAQFGVDDLTQFRERFQIGPDSREGLDDRTGFHHFFEAIVNALPTVKDGKVLSADLLQRYEQNILTHTQAINKGRLHSNQPQIRWKYHQYLALLFTELYLDRYFGDAQGLREALNEHTALHNASAGKEDQVTPWPVEEDARQQLGRLAFWCATGSGKTLLMHMHIKQYCQYHKEAFNAGGVNGWPKLDKMILITPNDGLSLQHATEFAQSGMEAIVLGDEGASSLFAEQANDAIKVLSIHKLRDEQGQTTVATESFEGCNLVLVDEGHRGAGSGDEGKWISRRDQLAKDGFCVEYSATFKEAIGNDETMRMRYARSILFDYAYRSFYRDGYGKDFTILNLEEDRAQERYLTMALLLFYQQLRVWADGGERMKPFLIDKPLWVFVGHTVTGGKQKLTQEDKASVSDVVEVLQFFDGFLKDDARSVALLQSLLEEGFLDEKGRDLLRSRLPHLSTAGDPAVLAQQLHAGILEDVFHAPGGGALAVQLVSGASGELAVKVGESEPFGVVNVGEPGEVAKRCEENGIVRLEDDQGGASLFKGINRDDSSVNLLVGSRKFTEGWNSWRVSSIGLMNMGKSEGTQIIQLFGRGVRLRGYGMSLRRSAVLPNVARPEKPKNLRVVETLQVFGVKASYMKTFREWVEGEVPEALERQIWELPVVQNLPKERKLRTLRLQREIDGVVVERGSAFRTLGPLVVLRPPGTSAADAWLRGHKTKLNWLPRILGIAGSDRKITTAVGEVVQQQQQTFTKLHLAMLNVDDLLFGLEAFKATKGLDRLHANREAIESLLVCPDWYELTASSDDMDVRRYENRLGWQRMAQQLINAYAERFYRYMRGCWESPYIEVGEVDERDLLEEPYTIEPTESVKTQEEVERLGEFVESLKRAVGEDGLGAWNESGRWKTVPFGGHLYQPLLYVDKTYQIRISPVSLNKSEADFVTHLAKWCKANEKREVYLLRNQAVTGLGFFQAANFYPDFLMWVHDGQTQHLVFVDPKGLHHHDPNDPKMRFAKEDIPKLQATIDKKARGVNTLKLHAYIISNTPYGDLNWNDNDGRKLSLEEITSKGIVFQLNNETTYIDTLLQQVLVGVATLDK